MSPSARVSVPRPAGTRASRPPLASYSPLVDAYIAGAAPFAQPILTHVRELVHKAVPGVEEVMKWSRPFFMYRGIVLGNISGFKQHCSVGLWGEEIAAQLRIDGVSSGEAMGSLGRIASLADLPPDKKLIAYFRQAARALEDGTRTKNYSRPQRVAKPELEVPADLAAALSASKPAQQAFAAFAPSHRREYITWITESKRDETRAGRLAQTIQWLAEGKRRNWKYETC